MVLVKERLENLEREYTYDEIAAVYNKLNHNRRLGPGIAKQMDKRDETSFCEFIAKKLSEKYTGSEKFDLDFKEEAEEVYAIFSKGPANISLREFFYKMPDEIHNRCMKVAERLK